MDYIRIKTTRQQDNKTISRDVTPVASELTVNEVKELLKDWIKLYPDSFAPNVEFKIYQLSDGDIIIELHEDLSSMAVALLVLYLETISRRDAETQRHKELVAESTVNSQQSIAFITIDDTEILLKQNEGKRAMVLCSRKDAETQSHKESVAESVEATTTNNQNPTYVRFILEDNYVLDYNFEKRPQPVKDCEMIFEETEFTLPDSYESVVVGDVVKKKIDEILEDEGLTPKKMLMYILCGAIGLSIGFLFDYFMGK